MRYRAWLLVAIALIGVGVAAAVVHGRGGARASTTRAQQPAQPKTYAQLVAANYKVLRPRQARRLLRFAEAFQDCAAKSVAIGEPKLLPTRILMRLPANASRPTLLRLTARCGARLGDPPPDSSLQLRKHVIVLYLPKRCLLDPNTVRSTN